MLCTFIDETKEEAINKNVSRGSNKGGKLIQRKKNVEKNDKLNYCCLCSCNISNKSLLKLNNGNYYYQWALVNVAVVDISRDQ